MESAENIQAGRSSLLEREDALALIDFIHDARDPESISNEMVAQLLEYFIDSDDSISATLDAFIKSRNKKGGYPGLGQDGKILFANLPAPVILFDGFTDSQDILTGSPDANVFKRVLFCRPRGTFVCEVVSLNGPSRYYEEWPEMSDFGLVFNHSLIPFESAIYGDRQRLFKYSEGYLIALMPLSSGSSGEGGVSLDLMDPETARGMALQLLQVQTAEKDKG